MTASERYSILIADDDDVHRATLRDIFEPRGYKTLLAADGQEAIVLVRNHHVDCLLLDVNMPILTGLETLRIVRRLRATVPCIFVTGEADRRLIRQAELLNAFSILSKPITRELVTATVRRALESTTHSS